MDDQHLKDLKPDDVSDAIRCLICLNTFSGQPVASPQHCDHFYCLTCITEWAKMTNSCPVDRRKFTVLYQRSCVGRGIQKIITVEPHDGQGLEEEERSEELSVCEECGRSDQRHLMLLCSACDSRFHTACLNPPLAAVPFEDWFCKECATEDSHTSDSFSREEHEIVEAEIMDLLSEVVPTSSRLRPSTTAQRAVSVHTRRSERVRQQSNRTHTTLSQTVQHVPRYLLKSSCSNSEDATTSNLLLHTQPADKKVTYKKTRRRKTLCEGTKL
ncbi:PHD and RING finger domain-containing protein 1-like [Neoarius graeffei]|uniref:PHD and RING finger domain-containing protein 1-like n=1 Tax=Neoarius graeffei TaxID=443677 RepID=UPI00298D01A2|nr:PHD and RING finger domain-containing protein 1-like [Neoarius graeffei]XP_060767204.1 PHD and RING finger domain-containing protein 1-like [Neoarius graeffei]